MTSTFKTDVDLVKSWYNLKRFEYQSYVGPWGISTSDKRRDTINSYLRMFKLEDSIYVAIAVPNSNKVKIYKNYKDNWNLKLTITTTGKANLIDFKCINNTIYFSSNEALSSKKTLYKSTNGEISSIVATGILGYFVDNNNGVWLTNSSGELSYNSTSNVLKTNPRYAISIFAVCPIDTTFFYKSRIENSYYGDTTYEIYEENFASRKTFLDNNSNIVSNGKIVFVNSKYKNMNILPRPRPFLEDLIFDQANEEITYQISSYISSYIAIYKTNYAPYFFNTSFVDSLGLLNEITKKINYIDTIHALDNSLNNNLTYSIIENPIGLSIADSIISINKEIPVGTYTIKFQVKDNFSIAKYDTLSWNLKIYSRKIKVSKTAITIATENSVYEQLLSTTDIDNDSSFIASMILPSWLTLSRTSKTQFIISGTPTHITMDTLIQIIVTDNSTYFDEMQKTNTTPSYDTLNYSITINKINVPPTFTSTPVKIGIVGEQYTYQVNAIDDQSISYDFLMNPTNMTITSFGLISWVPTDSGRYIVSISATDVYDAVRKQNFYLDIDNAPVINVPPVFTFLSSDVTIKETDSIQLKATASDLNGTTPSIKWYVGATLVCEDSIYKIKTDFSSSGAKTLKVIISDEEFSDTGSIVVTVIDSNRIPIVPKDTTLIIKKLDVPIEINVKAIDLDEDELIYTYDTTKFSVSSVVVGIKDSICTIILKKALNDTLIFSISDGKSIVSFKVKIISEMSTLIGSKNLKTLENSFNITSKGMIKYTIAKTNNIKLIVYSLNGCILYKNNIRVNAGGFNMKLNMAAGTYIYRFNVGTEFMKTNKIQIVK